MCPSLRFIVRNDDKVASILATSATQSPSVIRRFGADETSALSLARSLARSLDRSIGSVRFPMLARSFARARRETIWEGTERDRGTRTQTPRRRGVPPKRTNLTSHRYRPNSRRTPGIIAPPPRNRSARSKSPRALRSSRIARDALVHAHARTHVHEPASVSASLLLLLFRAHRNTSAESDRERRESPER